MTRNSSRTKPAVSKKPTYAPRMMREPRRHNPYRTESKQGVVRCPSCRGVNHRGHWISEETALELIEQDTIEDTKRLCPACQQSRDRYAMGVVEIHGDRWRKLSESVFQTIGNTEHIERARNDHERVLWSRSLKNVTKIYVSLPELARHIGRELRRAFKGHVEYHKSAEEPYLRVIWNSDWTEK